MSVRNIRRDATAQYGKLAKDAEISEDEQHRGEAAIQKITDEHVAKIDKLLKDKEIEVMEV